MLVSADEIMELKKARNGLELGMEKIERGQRPMVVKLSGQLGRIIEEIEYAQERAKPAHNPAVSTRMKLAKKGMLLAKELARFEMEVVGEFEKNSISEESGKRFVSIIKLIRANSMPAAKGELGYFEDIASLYGECEKLGEELKEMGRALKREQLKMEILLEEISNLEKETVDMEKVRRYGELLENLEKLKKIRGIYVQSLLSKPVMGLLGEIEKYSLKEYCGIFPEKEEMARLNQFFSDYPGLGKCNAGQIYGFLEFNEKKLAHICPETTRFKRVVLGSRELFETAGALEQTAFLAVEAENEKTLEFYAQRIDGAQEAVARIRQLRKEKDSDGVEYDKGRQIDKRRGELAKYSKTRLEEELKAIGNLLEILNSEATMENAGQKQESAPQENENKGNQGNQLQKGDGGGLFSGIGALIKKLAGKP